MRGVAMGAEHKAKGVNVALGPMMNMGFVSRSCKSSFPLKSDYFPAGLPKAVATGRALVQTHSYLVKLHMKRSSACNLLVYKRAQSITSTSMAIFVIGRNAYI